MRVRELTAVRTAGYRPGLAAALPGWVGPGGAFGALGPFALGVVDQMRRDDAVALGLEYLLTPVANAEFEVSGGTAAERAFVGRQLRRFWYSESLAVAMEDHPYGRAGAEAVYKEEGGRLHFDRLEPLHPRDVRPYTSRGRLAFVRVTMAGGGPVDLPAAGPARPAKGVWFVHGSAYSKWYGRSVLIPCWWAWRAKTQPDAALESLLRWVYKWGVAPAVIRHPDHVYEEEGREPVPAADHARRMLEELKAGGILAMSSAKDEHGQPLWALEQWARTEGRASDLIEPLEFLNKCIFRGMGIPDEVLQFQGEGSQARAQVSTAAFFQSRWRAACSKLQQFDTQVLRPLARWNGFRGGYELKVKPLLPDDKPGPPGPPGPPGGPGKGGDPLAALLGGPPGAGGGGGAEGPSPAGARMSLGRAPTAAEVEAAAAAADPDPSEAARAAGNYRKGHVTLHGLPIAIEVAKGGVRRGRDAGGREWSRTMAHHYGYVKRTTSDADGDHIDVYIGDHPESLTAYVIDQYRPDGTFDEHKAMLGFRSPEEAEAGYRAHYPLGWAGLGGVTALPVDVFRAWALHGDTRRPLAPRDGPARLSVWRLKGEGPRGGKVWVNERGTEYHGPEPPGGAAGGGGGAARARDLLRAARAAGHAGVSAARAAGEVASRVGLAAWGRLSPKARGRLTRAWRLARAVEHLAMTGFRKTRELAEEAARQRGVPPEAAARVGKVLGTADLVAAWAVNMPATLAATGSVTAAKASGWLPVASLAYLAYSTARNPFATLRAARKALRRAPAAPPPGGAALSLSAAEARGLAGELAGRLARYGDWYVALLLAALDETRDPALAVDRADAAVKARPADPTRAASLSRADPAAAAFYLALREEVAALREGVRLAWGRGRRRGGGP